MCWSDPAVAARTAIHVAASLRVGIGAHATTTALGHALDPDGDLVLAVSNHQVSTLARFVQTDHGEIVPGTAVAIDLAPVAVADRVRRTVTLHGPMIALTGDARAASRRLIRAREQARDPLGWADDDAHVVRLEPTSIEMTASCWCNGSPSGGHEDVDVADYLAAAPDPLAEVEAHWLRHLATDHEQELRALATHAAPWLDEVTLQVVPLAIDSRGMQLRVRTSDLCRDLHLAFNPPVACACEANHAVNDLFARAAALP